MSYTTNELTKMSSHQSGSSLSDKQNFEDLVTCSVCYEVYDGANELKLPKILPCQHTFCVDCLIKIINASPESNQFFCPQCKYKIENEFDPFDLPTSRIVLSLLEKESLNYNGYASCPCCREVRNLEVCFECNLPLCAQCTVKHFQKWKKEVKENCVKKEQTLSDFKQKIDKISPKINNNLKNFDKMKSKVEDAYNSMFLRLVKEKQEALNRLNNVQKCSSNYVNLNNNISALMDSFKVCRESSERISFESKATSVQNNEQNLKQFDKVVKDYETLTSHSFIALEGFRRSCCPDKEFKLLGDFFGEIIQVPEQSNAVTQMFMEFLNQKIKIKTQGSII